MSVCEIAEKIVKDIESTDDLSSYCTNLGEDVMRGKLDIVKIVEWLGPLLTNTVVVEREKGTSSLSYVLGALRPDFLCEKELTLLTAFFCDRMKDHHSLSSAILQGLLALIKMDNLPSDSPKLVCSSLFTHVHCQTLMQAERNCMYQIFQYLLAHKVQDLMTIDVDFVLGFITAIDGERDPNNLMLLFSILPRFLSVFPLKQLAEEAFSVISCYFPIDFNPAADDAKAITREDLALGLAPCLVGTPDFAEFCIPLILEKLESNRRVAKLDSLHVLRVGCTVWNAANLEPHMTEIWLALKRELVPGSTDLELRSSAADTLSEVLKLLSQGPNLLTTYLNDILASTVGLLSDTRLSLFSPAVDLLETVARTSLLACNQVTTSVVPKLSAMKQHDTPEETVIVIMNTLLKFAKASIEHSTQFDIGNEVWSPFAEMVLSSTTNAHNQNLQISAYNGLITLSPYLVEAQRIIIYDGCESSLSKGSEEVKAKCIELLKRIARIHPKEIMERIVHGKLKLHSIESKKEIYDWQVETLCGLAILPEYVNPISELLLGLIEKGSPATPTILHCLRMLLESSELVEDRDGVVEKLCRLSVRRLVVWWLEGFQHVDSGQQHLCLIDLAAIIECLIKAPTSRIQAEVTAPLVEMIVSPKAGDGHGLNTNNKQYKAKYSVVILEALLGSVRPDVPIHNWLRLTTALADLAFCENDPLTQASASRLLATLINKQQSDETLATVLGHIAKYLEQKLAVRDVRSKLNAVKLLSWVTKSLVLRGHGLMAYWIDKLTDQLADCGEVGKQAAEGFRLIMSEDKLYLTARSYCTLRIFYRQRLFQRAPALASISRGCPRASKLNYLTALAHLVQAVPRTVLLPSLRQVMLPMVESLDEGDGRLELTTLNTLSGLLAEKESALLSYTDTFIPRFMKLAKESPLMRVRIAALDCLKYYASYPSIQMMPYMEDVTTEIQSCLDDKKRLVRFAAVSARSAWFLINHNAEEDE